MRRLAITPAEEKILTLVLKLRLSVEYGVTESHHDVVANQILNDLENCGLLRRPKYLPKELSFNPHYDGDAEVITERPCDETSV